MKIYIPERYGEYWQIIWWKNQKDIIDDKETDVRNQMGDNDEDRWTDGI